MFSTDLDINLADLVSHVDSTRTAALEALEKVLDETALRNVAESYGMDTRTTLQFIGRELQRDADSVVTLEPDRKVVERYHRVMIL